MEVKIPQLGLTMESAALTAWLVSEGEQVSVDQPIAEIATDKVEHELVAPANGVITSLAPLSGDQELPVGAVIARIDPD